MPPRPLRELRDLVRYRKAKIQERGREVQRVEKTLQDAGIKLSSVASEVLGVSARLMLDALICGTHDPEILAELAKGALRKKIPALREALEGRFTGHHALLVGQMLAQIDFLDETIQTLSARVEELTRPFSREIELLDTIPGVDKRAACSSTAGVRGGATSGRVRLLGRDRGLRKAAAGGWRQSRLRSRPRRLSWAATAGVSSRRGDRVRSILSRCARISEGPPLASRAAGGARHETTRQTDVGSPLGLRREADRGWRGRELRRAIG